MYRVGVIERGTNGPPIYNGLRFATFEEAETYAPRTCSRVGWA